MNRQNLLESIANTISDYRLGEIPSMTTSHVDRWVSQFDDDEQLIILSEMDHLLSKYYISKSKAESFLTEILTSEEIFGKNPSALIQYGHFLDIQKKGDSQKDLLKLANEITMREYRISINQSSSQSRLYIYLDDCLFSGNRAFHDMQEWLNNSISDTNNPCYVYLIFLGCHTSAIRYLETKLIPKATQKNIHIKIKSHMIFNNLPWDKEKYESFWPVEFMNDELVNKFVDIVKEKSIQKSVNPRLFRPDTVPKQETLFSTPEARNIVESAFLRKGAYIASLPEKRKDSMRPMGFEYFESLGFGSVFITYRNIANNCPLVLWWGDTNYHHSHPFSKWYPLFPRKGNESSGTTNN